MPCLAIAGMVLKLFTLLRATIHWLTWRIIYVSAQGEYGRNAHWRVKEEVNEVSLPINNI